MIGEKEEILYLGGDLSRLVAPPNLLEHQIRSYRDFVENGFKELIDEISPIEDYTGNIFQLFLKDFRVDSPSLTEEQCIRTGMTLTFPVRAVAELHNKQTGEVKVQEVFLADLPVMTDDAYFVINGIKRVVVSQFIRSPGVFFTKTEKEGRMSFGAKIIPSRGVWLEIETRKQSGVVVKVDQGRAINWFTFLKAFGFTQSEIKSFFKSDKDVQLNQIYQATLSGDTTKDEEESLIELYKKIRPGDLLNVEAAREMFNDMFRNRRRYDLGKVGRFTISRRLKLDYDENKRFLEKKDLEAITKRLFYMIVNNSEEDDIDHLAFRRVKGVGEQLQEKVRVGVARFERVVKDRMSTVDLESDITPKQFFNIRPITAAIESFFASSQLSQFMDETNPIASLAHKRKLSAFGPGGLKRERAGFEVRDIHVSHYGRICPVETPEGPNIGLVTSIASYARINEFGFLEAPYRKVVSELLVDDRRIIGLISDENVDDKGKVLIERGTIIDDSILDKARRSGLKSLKIKPLVTDEIDYLMADVEEENYVAPFNTKLTGTNQIMDQLVTARYKGQPEIVSASKVKYIDVSPNEMISITTSLVPFIENNPSVRVLAGSNMNRQAVPLVNPEKPFVATGAEKIVAHYSGNVYSRSDGVVSYIDALKIIVEDKNGRKYEHSLKNYERTNQNTSIKQNPVVKIGDVVKKGEVIADGYAVKDGELALGKNILVAFMPWEGYNYQDAILISERLVYDDVYTSVHIEEYVVNVRDTNLGPESTTRDIPGKSEYALRNLDDEGIVRVGSEVNPGDILVGKITPRGYTELTAEERLLYAIFGEKAKDVKDSSLRLMHGDRGRVIDVQVFERKKGDNLPVGVIKTVKVYVAQIRKITVGDKMSARHGNKGIVSKILPIEDMPYMEDGTPVDIVLNPLGVFARMNIGQVLETHLGWAAKKMGVKYVVPPFTRVEWSRIQEELRKAGLPEDGKVDLYDGRTGKKFREKVAVGYMYFQKLIHMAEDKIHARSVGSYSMITQQPLGGKAQLGGQRLGEMEVWALEAHGVAHTLQEMLTIKSDDVYGRSKAYESIVQGEENIEVHMPASFQVLLKELQGIGIKIDPFKVIEFSDQNARSEKIDADEEYDSNVLKISKKNN